VKFSADGRKLFAGDLQGTVRVWEVNAGGEWVAAKTLAPAPQLSRLVMPSAFFPFFVTQWEFPPIIRLAVSTDGKHLAASHFSLTSVPAISAWSLAGGTGTPAFAKSGVRSTDVSFFLSVAFSPQGDLFAASYFGPDGVSHGVLIWNVATGQLKQTLLPDLREVTHVCFSADGKNLACAGLGGVALFDTVEFQRRLFVRGDFPYMAAFSPDSQLLAIPASQFSVVRLWNVVTNREAAVLRHPGWPVSVSFSGDGKRLISAANKSVHLWNLAGAAEKLTLSGHSDGVPGLAFSPTGKLLASAGKDRTVRLWDPVTGQIVRELRGFSGPVQSVAFNGDGRFLTATEWAGGVQIWEVQSGQKLCTVSDNLGPEQYGAGFSPDGKHFMTCGGFGVKVWNVVHAGPGQDGRASLSLKLAPSPAQVNPNSACFSPDSKLLAWVDTTGATQRLSVWDLGTAQERSWPTDVYPFLALSFLPDSKHLALVNWKTGQIEVWDATTGQVISAFGKKELLHGQTIHTALSSDGAWLAVGGSKAVTVWDLNKHELVLALPQERGTIWSLAWSPDKNLLAVGSSDGSLVVWGLPRIKTELSRIGLGW
jgi:WD40 repeat protein